MNNTSGLLTLIMILAILIACGIIISKISIHVSSRLKFIFLAAYCVLLLVSVPTVFAISHSRMLNGTVITNQESMKSAEAFEKNVRKAENYNSPELEKLKEYSFNVSQGSVKINSSAAIGFSDKGYLTNMIYWRYKNTNDSKLTVYVYDANYNYGSGINLCTDTIVPNVIFSGGTLSVISGGSHKGTPGIYKIKNIYLFDDNSLISQFTGQINTTNCYQSSATNVVVLVPRGITVENGNNSLKLPDIKK